MALIGRCALFLFSLPELAVVTGGAGLCPPATYTLCHVRFMALLRAQSVGVATRRAPFVADVLRLGELRRAGVPAGGVDGSWQTGGRCLRSTILWAPPGGAWWCGRLIAMRWSRTFPLVRPRPFIFHPLCTTLADFGGAGQCSGSATLPVPSSPASRHRSLGLLRLAHSGVGCNVDSCVDRICVNAASIHSFISRIHDRIGVLAYLRTY